MSDEEAPILDLAPRILARKIRDCRHPRAVVDESAAVLECAECGVALDPWTFLRSWARMEARERERLAEVREHIDAEIARMKEKARVEADRLNAHLARLTAEVNTLITEKNRLWNLVVPGDGRPLGAVTVRQRKRAVRVSTGKPTSDP